jgi:hypothetical protein
MKEKIVNWVRHWSIIDLVGLGIGFLLIILFMLKTVSFNNARIDDIWSNLATEIIGVWLSVRIIDSVIQRRNKKNRTRLQILRNLKHFLNVSNNFVVWNTPKMIDFEELLKEQSYFKQRWDKRKKYLFDSEIEKVEKLERFKQLIIDEIKILLTDYKQDDTVNSKHDKTRLRTLLHEYDDLLENLREDIWEESHPDDL